VEIAAEQSEFKH